MVFIVVLAELTVSVAMEDMKESFSVREERTRERQAGKITLQLLQLRRMISVRCFVNGAKGRSSNK